MDADALANKIDQAQSIEHLDALEQDSLQIEGVSRRLLGLTIGSKRRELIAIQRQKGAYLVDAQTIFYLDKPDGKDPKPEEAFDLIRRKETPPFYQKLVDDAAAAFKNGHKPNLKQVGGNKELLGRGIRSIIRFQEKPMDFLIRLLAYHHMGRWWRAQQGQSSKAIRIRI